MAEIKIIPETLELIKMSDEEYFSEKYRGYISNSSLSKINPDEGGSLEKYLAPYKQEYSDSFELGSALHAMVLQPDSFIISDIRKPNAKLGIWAEEVFKLRSQGLTLIESFKQASFNANYYAGTLNDNKLKVAIKKSLSFYLGRMKVEEISGIKTLFISEPVALKYAECIVRVKENQKIHYTLNPEGLLEKPTVFNEYAIFCEADFVKDDDTIKRIKLKGKIDNFTLDREECVVTLNDLKTTGKPLGFFMGNLVNQEGEEVWYDGSFQKYHYYRQVALYGWLLQSALKQFYNINYQLKVNMLVVETIPYFNGKIFVVNGNFIKEGLKELKQLLTLVVDGTT